MFRTDPLGSHSVNGTLLEYGKAYFGDKTFPYIGNQYFLNLVDQVVLDDAEFYEEYFLKEKQYDKYIVERSKHNYFDLYAAYQPFNEALRSLYPFLKLARKNVAPGENILNLWDRNGWTTALLLGMFPSISIPKV